MHIRLHKNVFHTSQSEGNRGDIRTDPYPPLWGGGDHGVVGEVKMYTYITLMREKIALPIVGTADTALRSPRFTKIGAPKGAAHEHSGVEGICTASPSLQAPLH